MMLLKREARPDDYAKGTKIYRSCGGPRTLDSGRDTYARFDRYMGDCGRGSMLDKDLDLIQTYIKNVNGGKFDEK